MVEEVRGVAPGLLLVPAREHKWEIQEKVEISIPKPIPENLKEDGPFYVTEYGFSSLWQIVPLLFAAKKYPDLADDQCLNITAMEENDTTITLYGQLLKAL